MTKQPPLPVLGSLVLPLLPLLKRSMQRRRRKWVLVTRQLTGQACCCRARAGPAGALVLLGAGRAEDCPGPPAVSRRPSLARCLGC